MLYPMSQKSEKTTSATYFTPYEVALHNSKDDIWVSYLGRVYDLTSLIKKFYHLDTIKPIIAHSGKDITEWFQSSMVEPKEHIHPVTFCKAPCGFHGERLHTVPVAPCMFWKPIDRVPWWKNSKYMVGHLTECTRRVRIVNVLTDHVDIIQVCSEDSLNRIQERFMDVNGHIGSYTWKCEGKELNMNLTLEQNGFIDESKEFVELNLPVDLSIPTILIYYNDDLTPA